jgi:hypothetical protein
LTHTVQNGTAISKDRLLFIFWYTIILGVPGYHVVKAKAKLGIADERNIDNSDGGSLDLLVDKLEE